MPTTEEDKMANKKAKQCAEAPFMARQGDVLVVATDEKIPDDATLAPDCILAHGEVTGHKHQIHHGAKMFMRSNGEKWLSVEDQAPVDLVHEEHGTVSIPGGKKTYKVIQQREYLPQGQRNVAD